MTKSLQKNLLLTLSALIFLFGISSLAINRNGIKCIWIDDCNIHNENENCYVVMSGKLNFQDVTLDSVFNFSAPYPLIKRKVQMHQYLAENRYSGSKPQMKIGWSEEWQKPFSDFNNRQYSNPEYPSSSFVSDVYASCMTMNNGNLKIDSKFTESLVPKENKNNLIKMVPIRINENNKCPDGFGVKNGNFYKSSDHPDEIGAIEIAYTGLKIEETAEFTIIGKQLNGTLTLSDYNCKIYNSKKSLEEIQQDINNNPYDIFFPCIFISLLLFTFAKSTSTTEDK